MSELIYNIQNIFVATGRESCLQQHGCTAYRIPPYQRGYKWGSDENQPVHTLLSDLQRAWKSKAKEYLLQAITVKRVSDERGGWVLEVIDGQQRLTTLFILIHALKRRLTPSVRPNIAENKLRYSIRHEAPTLDELVAACLESDSAAEEDFDGLKQAHRVDEEERQDCYYLKCAALRCVHALRDHSADSAFQSAADVADFQEFVLREVKLMVNAVEAHISGEEIFGNLNSNRIVLTETELIKGLLLTRVAREPAAIRPRRYREVLEMRIRLGREWDAVNQWASVPEIKRLYFPDFQDGMRGLLELVARQMPEPFKPAKGREDGKALFEYFFRQERFEPVFRLLANTCAQLQDWHEDRRTYHLLGYCLVRQKRAGERVRFLAEQLSRKTKTELLAGLYARRRNILGGPTAGDADGELALAQLGYGGNDDPRIEAVLLALSVFQAGASGRFNFFALEDERWSLEHIFPQSPLGKEAQLNDVQWRVIDSLIANEEGILKKETAEQIAQLRNAGGEPDRAEIERLLQSEPLLHRIGNLCLLSSEDNAAMGCGMFDEKRRVIRDRIARGSFVPSHTYEVFSKMIVGDEKSLDVWSKGDIENHQAEIVRRIRVLVEEEA